MALSIRQYIETLNLSGGNYRGDCPACHNRNTFSVSRNNGQLSWFCFHTSCNLKGKQKHALSVSDIRGNVDSNNVHSTYILPDTFCSVATNNRCTQYLLSVNSYDFAIANPALVKYDPKLNRCVFILKHEGQIKGATGRSLDISTLPKWYIYSRLDECPFIVHKEYQLETCILVEDPPSCCNISNYINGIGLLGTNVPNNIIQYINSYRQLYIALDDDATGKAVKLQKELSVYKPTKILPLIKDLKYYNKEELYAFLSKNSIV